MSTQDKHDLIARVQTLADEIIPTGYAIDPAWQFAQNRAIDIVRQFTRDLEIFSVKHAYNVALIELNKLDSVCAHQTHDLMRVHDVNCTCDYCREFLTRDVF